VLQQHPKAGTHVKEGRKIYLTLNAPAPPQVKMPNLVDGSVRNAHIHLKSQGLLLGAIKYIPDIAQNAVLEQRYQGVPIAPGTLVNQGSKIDLIVGAGLSKKQVAVPEVIGMPLEEAQLLLLSAGIKLGNIAYETARLEAVPGTIWRQVPAVGEKVYLGESIDVWLVPLPAEATTSPAALPEEDVQE
ncbi:MAG: PASTA domain-containing protein, partial [Bacteroidota bacterium]